ncbi:OLC1v1007548C1 [Oldenlandia corymbosa var. corymbosa]|uniref:OLC1v1007548C1 n=1 Tax=Oldenlandia corymbosa var. corymbosa TaxID=529605 RepID=A0AAV1DJX4_OLDCO|nr:OLC1v1007548C1 [Oldenlandia corymbosa var. corymbosa]
MDRKLKQYQTCVDPALDILDSGFGNYSPPTDLERFIRHISQGLNLFKMLFWGFGFPQELVEPDWMLGLTLMVQQFRGTAEEFRMKFEAPATDVIPEKPLSYSLWMMMEEHKSLATEICYVLLQHDQVIKCKYQPKLSSHPEYGLETLGFIDLILKNLCSFTGGILIPVKQQIDFIRGKLKLFRNFVVIPLNKWPPEFTRTGELIYHIQTWASHISCLLFSYWVDEIDDECLASEMGTRLSDLMRKSSLYHPETIGLFLDVFMSAEYHKFEGLWSPWLLEGYVGFLLEHVATEYASHDIEILWEGLIFLLSFVMDSPKEDGSEETALILAEIDAIISEVPFVISNPDNHKLSSLLDRIDGAKDRARKLFVVSPLSSRFTSPRTNAIRFLDSLSETLQNMLDGGVDFIPSMKNQIVEVHQGLASLRPFLQLDLEPQTENFILTDLQTQIVNVIHYATYVTKLCPIRNPSVWYGILFLQSTIQDINLLRCEVKKIQDDLHICSSKKLNTQMTSSNNLVLRETSSKQYEGTFIGFKEERESILDILRGPNDLIIISITGMPGQGKTRLAQDIFADQSVHYHFHKIAWCYLSKGCETSKSLLKILQAVSDCADGNLQIQDIVEVLRKSLKGKRYFVVLDDIWDVNAWFKVKDSFPNDKNGSRILFTSRNDALASQCRLPGSLSHHLRSFSIDESWDLMRDKIPDCDDLSPELVEVGLQIADYCKGLPLAVAVIASYLKRIARELETWKEVAKNMKSHLTSEGCMHVIELSYKHLPHHLKLCFLCFGAFEKGSIIYAKNLIRFWIDQRFIENSEMHSSEELAYQYLDDLISQNLVVVSERGLMGKIKSCHVHDLIYDLCVQKAAVEDNLLHWVNPSIVLDRTYDRNLHNFHHHIWLSIGDCDLASSTQQLSSNSTRKELWPTQVCSLLWSHYVPGPIQYASLSSFLGRFSVLTRCDMMNVNLVGSSFPQVILHNIHLRYLALRGSFSDIPSSISNLWNLETLILYSVRGYVTVPDSLWKMKTLNSVSVGDFHLDTDDFEHSVYSTAEACNIEKLSQIKMCDSHMTVEFLRRLKRLKKLKCFYCKQFGPESLSEFGSLEKLEKLSITVCCKNPLPPNWRSLQLDFPCTLKKLSLSKLNLPWRVMSTIGKLPNLQVLTLHKNACNGDTWDLRDGEFLKLTYLLLCQMNVKRINDSDCSDSPLPCLEKLYLGHCTRLEEIPSSFGDICCLNTFLVNASPKAFNSVEMIVEQQREMGNDDLHYYYSEHCRRSDYHTYDGVYDDESYDDDNGFIPMLEAFASPSSE